MELCCPKESRERETGSDTEVGPGTPCVRLKLCCDSARPHRTPLCTTVNPALCCHTAVIPWLSEKYDHNAEETIQLIDKSYIIATKMTRGVSVNTKVQ